MSRPTSFDEFIGQQQVVDQVKVALDACKAEDRAFPHTFMSGPPGLGKTTLAGVIAEELGGKLVTRIATGLNKVEDLAYAFAEADRPNSIVFIDEAEQLSRGLTEALHTVLEGGVLTLRTKTGGVKTLELPEITVIIATNYIGELPRPFLDRFKLRLVFEPYSEEDLYKVLAQACEDLEWYATTAGITVISRVSRGTPRIALRYFEAAHDLTLSVGKERAWLDKATSNPCVTCDCVREMMVRSGVDFTGMTPFDRRVLKALLQADRPIGLRGLAVAVGDDISAVALAEEWLVKEGYVALTANGRALTAKGRKTATAVKEDPPRKTEPSQADEPREVTWSPPQLRIIAPEQNNQTEPTDEPEDKPAEPVESEVRVEGRVGEDGVVRRDDGEPLKLSSLMSGVKLHRGDQFRLVLTKEKHEEKNRG
jgi:Holliday junction DNA helicase RuvB